MSHEARIRTALERVVNRLADAGMRDGEILELVREALEPLPLGSPTPEEIARAALDRRRAEGKVPGPGLHETARRKLRESSGG